MTKKKKIINLWPEVLRNFLLVCSTLAVVGGVVLSWGKPIANEFVKGICVTEQEKLYKQMEETNKKLDELLDDIEKLVFFYMETTEKHKIEGAKDKWEQKKLFSE